MRKMLLGIYLAVLGLPCLLLLGSGSFGIVCTILLYIASALLVLDGFFAMGPKSHEDGEEDDQPPLPPQYKSDAGNDTNH